MRVFTRAAFSVLFLAAFFSLPAVLAEREAETGKKARPQVDGADVPRGDPQQAKVI